MVTESQDTFPDKLINIGDIDTRHTLDRMSVELAADEVFWMQSDSRIVYVNRSACERLGYSQEEMLSMYVWEWDPNFTPEIWDAFLRDFSQSREIHFETQHTTKSGETFPVEINGYYRELNGEPVIFAFVKDISLRKDAEKKLEDYQAGLEKLIEERTAELKAALYEAKAADEAKTRFLSNMSHEIRTPLNGVLGMAQVLSRTELDNRQAKILATIRSSGEALLTVINDVLDLSKIDAGAMPVTPEKTDIEDMIGSAADAVKGAAEIKSLPIYTNISPKLPSSMVLDRRRVSQILINFLGNAVKFTAGGHVTLAAEPTEYKGIRLTVSDTGPGIPTDKYAKVFERFEQVDNSATRAAQGSGIGLAICKELVALMGGTIGIDANYTKGARFWIELPEL